MTAFAVAAPAPGALPAAHAFAREPVLRIRAQASFDTIPRDVRAGDTVTYRLRVEWNEFPAAVMLVPRETLDAPGFTRAGSAVEHARAGARGEWVNRTDFVYALVPREAGTARVAAFTLRYHNGLTGREEELNVPAATLPVLPARGAWLRGLASPAPAWLAGALAFVVLAVVLVLYALRTRKGPHKHPKASLSTPTPSPAPSPEAIAIERLRARCDAADGAVWMRDAERLCIDWLSRRIGVTNSDHVRFDAALEQYLQRHPGLSLAARRSWTTLRDLFHEARYAGAPFESRRLHETCGHLANCLTRNASLGDQTP